jgi:effector-binding domain-containing protein
MEPTIVERPTQPYVGIQRSITMTTFPEIADRLPELFGWLGRRGIAPAGAPFFRYHLIDMARELRVEAGIPLAGAVEGEGEIVPGVLPAGRYVRTTHRGHPQELLGVTADMLTWAARQGLRFDKSDTDEGEAWGSRLEFYLTDPTVEPDMNYWEHELLFKLAEA